MALVPEGRHEAGDNETPFVDNDISNQLLRKIEKKLVEEDERKKKMLDKKRIQKIKQKNLSKIVEQQNQQNMQMLQFQAMDLPKPVVSDAELVSIGRMTADMRGGGRSAMAL